LSVEELRNHIAQSLCDGEKVLTEDEVHEIEKIEQGYYAPEFLRAK